MVSRIICSIVTRLAFIVLSPKLIRPISGYGFIIVLFVVGEITRFICDYYNFVPKEDDCDDEKNLRSVNESLSCPTTQIIPALGKISLSILHVDYDVSYHETSTLSLLTPNILLFL